jgi:hypothetical protein
VTEPSRTRLLRIIAPALPLLAGLLNFTQFNDYPFLRSELFLCAVALVAAGVFAGLLASLGGRISRAIVVAAAWALFLDVGIKFWGWHPYLLLLTFVALVAVGLVLYEHLTAITVTAAAAVILTTVFIPSDRLENRPPKQASDKQNTENLPPVIHIILDAHIGIAGLPLLTRTTSRPREDLMRFFAANNFLLFTNAYSHYFNSQQSIPNTLNFSDGPSNNFFEGSFHSGGTLMRNQYFERMIARGYEVHVIQTDYIDFCQSPDAPVSSCYTVAGRGPKSLDTIDIDSSQKSIVILSQFLELSVAYKNLRNLYNSRLVPALGARDIDLPYWNWERPFVFPIVAPQSFKRLTETISTGAPGRLFFFHAGIPHEPYVFSRDCQIRRSVRQWTDRSGLKKTESDSDRETRNSLYLEQLACVQKLLSGFFSELKEQGIFDKAIIIVHGDHGSRIMSTAPYFSNREYLENRDLVAAYSTFFAAKTPAHAAGLNGDALPLDWLLEFAMFDTPIDPPPDPFVYLGTKGKGGRLVPIPFRAIGSLPALNSTDGLHGDRAKWKE